MAKTNPLGALAAAVGMLVAAGLLVLMLVVVQPRPAGATFPGPNGKIAYMVLNDSGIYTINPGGGGKTKVAVGQEPSYSPDGKRIAYECYKALGTDDGEDFDSEICTINVGGVVSLKLPTPPIPWPAALLGGEARSGCSLRADPKQWDSRGREPGTFGLPSYLPSSPSALPTPSSSSYSYSPECLE